jgi:hypothetical protein
VPISLLDGVEGRERCCSRRAHGYDAGRGPGMENDGCGGWLGPGPSRQKTVNATVVLGGALKPVLRTRTNSRRGPNRDTPRRALRLMNSSRRMVFQPTDVAECRASGILCKLKRTSPCHSTRQPL